MYIIECSFLDLKRIAYILKSKADFENANREARAYKRLVAHMNAYRNSNNEVARFYIEIALDKALDYAFLALKEDRKYYFQSLSQFSLINKSKY